MAVVVRLSRGGGPKKPFYRIVAADSRRPRDGRFLEKLGTYDPTTKPAKITLKRERLEHWVKHGAQLSPKVQSVVAEMPV
jgi:small subunit ribosomal protein S16